MNLLKSVMIIVALTLVAGLVLAQNRSQSQQFQEGINLMETKGNYPAAIRLFEETAKGPDRALAARSLFYVGLCYEKIGKDKAERAYKRLIEQYADQRQVVAEARARLSALSPTSNVAASKTATGPIVRQVWAGPDVGAESAPSPDGRYLSFSLHGNVAVRDLTTGEVRRLTDIGLDAKQEAEETIWSPDGKQIAYAVWNCVAGFGKCVEEVRVIGLDGSNSRVLYHNDQTNGNTLYGWSPDGKYILAMFDQRDSTHQLVQVAVADGSVQVVKKLEDRHEISVSLSPDGRYLAFDAASQKTSSKHDIFSLSVDGSRETPLVQNPADNRLLGWTPDGRSILFATDRSGTYDAWIVPVSDGKAQGAPELVRRDLGKIRPLGFTRGGSFYYSLGAGNVQDIYTARLDPETSKLIGAPELAKTRFTGKNSGIDWSPDGRYLVYRSLAFKDGDPYKLVILNPETGEEREVRTKLKNFNRPRWFPDGKSIFVRGWTGPDAHNGAGLFKINSETGDATLIAPEKPGAELFNPMLSRDGKAVFYQNKNILWKRNLETGEDKEIYRQIYRPTTPTENFVFAQSIALSPDGQRLAFLLRSSAIGAPFTQSLLVIPATGGDARELLKVREPEFFADSDSNVAWTPDGRYVFFVKERGLGWQQSELWRISADGGEPQKLGQVMGRVFEVRIHPDGQRIAFTHLQWNKGAEVWVMENFLPSGQKGKGSVAKR